MIVADIMTREVETLSPNTPLKEAARRMIAGGFSGMPVVNAESRVVGILTEADFISPHPRGSRSRRLLRMLTGDGETELAEADVVAELMSSEVLSVHPGDTIRTAARIMAKNSIKRLPVVDDHGQLLGIISRADLLQVFARPDEEISEDIAATVQMIPLPMDLDQLTITVNDGEVMLAGKVETSADAAVLEHVVSRLEGVTDVVNELTWDVDLSRPEQRWPGFDQGGAPGHR